MTPKQKQNLFNDCFKGSIYFHKSLKLKALKQLNLEILLVFDQTLEICFYQYLNGCYDDICPELPTFPRWYFYKEPEITIIYHYYFNTGNFSYNVFFFFTMCFSTYPRTWILTHAQKKSTVRFFFFFLQDWPLKHPGPENSV